MFFFRQLSLDWQTKILFFLTLIFSPVTLMIFTLGSLLKKGVASLARRKWGHNNFLGEIDSADLMFVSDTFNTKPHSAYVIVNVLKGIVEERRISEDLQRLYDTERDEKGEKTFWKLGAFPVKFMGYWFWKQASQFEMKKQVYHTEWNVETDAGLCGLVDLVKRRKFPEDSACWDITFATNHKENKTFLLFRCAHSVMDGLSYIKLFYRLGGKPYPMQKGTKSVAIPSTLDNLNLLKKMGTEGIKTYLGILYSLPEKNIFYNGAHTMRDEWGPTGDWNCAFSPTIPLDMIKYSRKAYNTSFYCIVLSAVIRGLKNFLDSLPNENGAEKDIPDAIKTIMPMVKLNHPGNTLCNHWRPFITDLPMGERNVRETISAMHNSLLRWQASAAPELGGLVFRYISALPLGSYIDELTNFTGLTVLSSILAFPEDTLPTVFGAEMEEAFHFVAIHRENAGTFSWACLSSNRNVRITVTTEKIYFPNKEYAGQIAHYIHQQFHTIFQEAKNMGKEADESSSNLK